MKKFLNNSSVQSETDNQKLNQDKSNCLMHEVVRESEECFRSAFDYAAIGMALVAPDGCWLQVNRSLCQIVGYKEQELLSTTFQAIAHPDDLEIDLDYVRQMLSGEIRNYQMEKRYVHKLGHIVWILLSVSLVRDVEGQPLYFIAQLQDITARKQAEAALYQSEAKSRALLSAIPDLMMRMSKDGTYRDFIPAQNFRTVNADRNMQGKNLWNTMPKEVAEKRMYYVEQALATGQMQIYEFQLEIDGQIQHEEVRIVVSGADEVLILVRDISERKRAEEALKASLREKEVLLKEIHHRVKNNLQIISGLLYLQSRYVEDRHTLQVLQENRDRIQSMALLHEKLYGSQNLDKIDFRDYISSLSNNLLISYGVNTNLIGLKLDIEPVSLNTLEADGTQGTNFKICLQF